MITDYFILNIFLPPDEVSGDIAGYVSRFEREILIKTLGFHMYNELIESLSGTPEQKWLDLRDGKIYQKNGINHNWRGLINDEKESLIAYYVWYQYSIHGMEVKSISGIKNLKTENTNIVDRRLHQVSAYNKMVDLIAEMDNFIQANSVDYPYYAPELIRKVNMFNF